MSPGHPWRAGLLALAAAVTAGGCSLPSAPMPTGRWAPGGATTDHGTDTGASQDAATAPAASPPSPPAGQSPGGTSVAVIHANVTGAGTSVAISYPTSIFKGAGTASATSNVGSKTANVTQTIEVDESDSVFDVAVTQINSDNSDFNQAIQSSLGKTSYDRVDADAANIPVSQRFLAFADKLQGPGGAVSFATPLPIQVFPDTNVHRYDALSAGPMAFSTQATGPNGSFTINILVAGQASGSSYVITTVTDIPEDTDGTLFGLTRLAPKQVLTIDLTQGRVAAFSNDLYWHADPNIAAGIAGIPADEASQILGQIQVPPREPMHLDYMLCTYQEGGDTQNLGC